MIEIILVDTCTRVSLLFIFEIFFNRSESSYVVMVRKYLSSRQTVEGEGKMQTTSTWSTGRPCPYSDRIFEIESHR